MTGFKREEFMVGGVKTVVHSAGEGDPLVFFHGGGTVEGFAFAERWADSHRVIVPYHPGFGESGDDPTITNLHDYVMHYLELFDMMKLDTFDLVGLSFGGYLAAKFASEHGHRIRKLALIAPAGIIDHDHPPLDILMVPGDQLAGMLVSNFDTLKPFLPQKPSMDFIGERYREAGSLARLLWEHPADPKFMRYLHRVTMPTMILWGEDDKIVPVQQTETWRKFIPHSDIKVFKGAGHLVHFDKPEAVEVIGKFLG